MLLASLSNRPPPWRRPESVKKAEHGVPADQQGLLSSHSSSHVSARIAHYTNPSNDDTPHSTYCFLYVVLGGLLVFIAFLYLSASHSSSSPSPQQSLADEVAPPWLIRARSQHMFDWTWRDNGDHSACLSFLSSPALRSLARPTAPPPASLLSAAVTVNDVQSYLSQAEHRNEGVIVDFFPQLPNPHPHPLPLAKDFLHLTCPSLHLDGEGGWAMCKRKQDELNEWLPATTHVLTAAFFSAYVDAGSCNDVVPGTVFTPTATFHLQRWTNNPCHNDPIRALPSSHNKLQHFTELIDTVGTYLSATGHFAPQQLPRLIRSLAVCPPTAKVLVASGGVATHLLDILVERNILSRDRIVPFQSNTVYHADVVYRTETFPYLTEYKYNHYAHDRTDMELVHNTMVDEVDDDQRTLVVIIKRGENSPRALASHPALVAAVSASLSSRPLLSHLSVVEFTAAGHVRDHIALFRRAVVMIGSHGAGMLNLYWMKRGSHVMEIGYDSGMTMPEMYAEMAIHSGHRYWLVMGKGDYDGKVELVLDDWNWSWGKVLEDLENKEEARRATRPPPGKE